MKQILRTVAATVAITFGFNAQAQIPDNGIWPSGVVLTDIDGVQHDIDAILDAGKPVVLDAFADWCPPCWTYHQGHALEDLYTAYGPDGTDELMVFGVESDPGEAEANISDPNTGEGDWTVGISYPLANDDNVAGIINQAYYPTIILICPDRTVTEVGQISTAQHYTAAQACGAAATDANDGQLLSYLGETSTCDDVQLEVLLQNYGTSNLTSATISAYDGGTQVATTNWTGNLAPYEVANVVVGSVTPTGNTTYSIEIDDTDDNVSNNTLSQQITEAPSTGNIIKLEVTTDYYPGETSWEIRDGNNAVVESGSYQAGTDDQFGAGGPDALITHEYFIDLGSADCYTFILEDSYGDGMIYNGGTSVSGFGAVITSYDGNTTAVDIDGTAFENSVDGKFQSDGSSEGASLDENTFANNMNVYPNPASNNVNVDFTLSNDADATVELLNGLGQVVSTQVLGHVSGEQSVSIDVASLESGMYIVKVKTSNGEITKRVSVVK